MSVDLALLTPAMAFLVIKAFDCSLGSTLRAETANSPRGDNTGQEREIKTQASRALESYCFSRGWSSGGHKSDSQCPRGG